MRLGLLAGSLRMPQRTGTDSLRRGAIRTSASITTASSRERPLLSSRRAISAGTASLAGGPIFPNAFAARPTTPSVLLLIASINAGTARGPRAANSRAALSCLTASLLFNSSNSRATSALYGAAGSEVASNKRERYIAHLLSPIRGHRFAIVRLTGEQPGFGAELGREEFHAAVAHANLNVILRERLR